jgi:hypothetical protein
MIQCGRGLGLALNPHPTTTELLDDAVVRDGVADHWSRNRTSGNEASQ